MFTTIIGFIEAQPLIALGAGIGSLVFAWIFKAIPNSKISEPIRILFKGFGITITLGLSKWKWTAPIWNKLIEPFLVDLIDNTIGSAIKGFIEGLRSDNP